MRKKHTCLCAGWELPIWALLVSIWIFLYSFFPPTASAYERVVFNEGVGYATSTFGASEKMIAGAGAVWGTYAIDCVRGNIAEIASTTVSLYTDSSTRSGFYLRELSSGRRSDQGYTISNTAKDYSFTFTPPIWCSGSTAVLAGDSYSTRLVNFSVKGGVSDPTGVDDVPFARCIGSDTGCNMGNVRGADIAIIAMGTFATSAPSSVSTTTYNFYFSTSTLTATDTSISLDETNTILLTFFLLSTLAVFGVISYNYTYGRSRRT